MVHKTRIKAISWLLSLAMALSLLPGMAQAQAELADEVILSSSAITLIQETRAVLTATVAPEGANDAVTWSSSDPEIATVTEGTVTAVAAGTATITVTATNGTPETDADDVSATCTVTVLETDAAVSYLDWDGEKLVEKTCEEYTLVTDSTEWSAGWYVVSGTVNTDSIDIGSGDLNLILCDGAKLTASAGIVTDDGSLTIYAQSGGTGVLEATGNYYGIYVDEGMIEINGGSVTAAGTYDDGIYVYSGDNGGSVTATGGDEGINVYSGDMVINGGTVTATGDYSGIYVDEGMIEINGGSVTATGGDEGIDVYPGDVIINGGSVTATGTNYEGICVYGDLTINGGSLTATSTYDEGIYTYYLYMNGGSLTADSTADGGYCGIRAFLGMEVSGGTVTATADGYGIYAFNRLTITGGDVTASGTEQGIYIGRTLTLAGNLSVKAGEAEDIAAFITSPFAEEHSQKWVHIGTDGPAAPAAQPDNTPNTPPEGDYVAYLDKNGKQAYAVDFTEVDGSDEPVTWDAVWYVVKEAVEIKGEITFSGDVHLILCDGAKLTASAGIETYDGSLTIYAQSGGTGVLEATGGNSGIYVYEGMIEINGGTVTATGDDCGIYDDWGCLEINGGSVTATGTNYEGICVYGDLTINGGSLTATSTYDDGIYTYYLFMNGGTLTASSENDTGIYTYYTGLPVKTTSEKFFVNIGVPS